MNLSVSRIAALTAALALASLASPAMTSPIGINTENPVNAPSLLPYAEVNASTELQKVVTLLGTGKREEAKTELARFLAKRPQDPRATELAGLIFMEEKNWKMAAVSFQRTLAADPRRTSARSKLGVALMMEGKTQEGKAELEKAIAGNSTDAIARRYLGWLAETQGDTQGALKHYDAMITGSPSPSASMSEFHVLAARLYNQIQRPDLAIRLLEPLAGKTDSRRTAQLTEQVLASAYLEEGNKAASAKLVRSLEKTLPASSPELRMLQAGVLKLEKDYAKARERLQAVIQDSPAYRNPASFQLAQVYSEEGNWRKAIEVLESLAPSLGQKDLAVALARLTALQFANGNGASAIPTLSKYASKDPVIKYLLAEAQARNHDYDSALRTVNELLRESPGFAGGHYLYGMLYKHENKLVHMEKGFSQAVKLIPAYLDAWMEWADAYATAGMGANAENILARGLEANPDNPLLLFKLATLQEYAGKIAQANLSFRRILEKMPNHGPALQRLALNLSADPATLAEARKFAERAYNLNRNEPVMQDTYGWVLVQSGDEKKGIPLLESAVKGLRNGQATSSRSQEPGEDHAHPEENSLHEGMAYFHLGAAYMKLGKTSEGSTYLNRALGLGVSPSAKIQITALLK
jgi:predicted Zn-dependent protease